MATISAVARETGARQVRIDERVVFAKTAEGIAEVRARAFGLSLSARRVLIMVDGTRSVSELSPLLRPGEIDAVLMQLESMRLVFRVDPDAQGVEDGPEEQAGAPARLNDGAAPGSEPVAEESHMATVDGAKRRAVRELNERLGPDAETMAIRIEQCRGVDELRDRLREAERLVAGFLGESAAQEFVRAMRRRYSTAE
ncbi:MAG TPA: hypothetical protein VMU33_05335 [Burkholderiaceae bacterium]|nr:hypothetical protein [Burkholderiaceae bacterium]